MEEVIGPAVAGGQIRIVGEMNADGWKPDNAMAVMEKILVETGNNIDAVLVQNDGMTGGAIMALTATGLTILIDGQDRDPAAPNRFAMGAQTVSVWKNNFDLAGQAGRIVIQLAEGTPMNLIPDARQFSGGARGVPVWSILLNPRPITGETLDVVIDADHVTQKDVCREQGRAAFCRGLPAAPRSRLPVQALSGAMHFYFLTTEIIGGIFRRVPANLPDRPAEADP